MEKMSTLKYILIGVGVLVFLFSSTIENQYYAFTKSSAEATIVSNEITGTSSSRRGGTKYLQTITASFLNTKGETVKRSEKGYESRSPLEEGRKINVYYDPSDSTWFKVAR